MSLAIDVRAVRMVLLNDGWHRVVKESFIVDVHGYQSGEDVVPVPGTGATWLEGDDTRVYCPLTAILAVRTGEAPDQRRR